MYAAAAMRRVFVSCSHRQAEWVLGELCVALRAGGAQVLVDRERFEAGYLVHPQMDDLQARAERNVPVLSPDYLRSPYWSIGKTSCELVPSDKVRTVNSRGIPDPHPPCRCGF